MGEMTTTKSVLIMTAMFSLVLIQLFLLWLNGASESNMFLGVMLAVTASQVGYCWALMKHWPK